MEENEEDMDNFLDSLEGLIKRVKKVSKGLHMYVHHQLESAKVYVSEIPDKDKRKSYEDRIKQLEKLFYGKNEEDEESNCLPCYG